MIMNKKYYIKNILWGVTLLVMDAIISLDDIKSGNNLTFHAYLFISALLCPFSKFLIESVALKYTEREFWNRGLFIDTPAKMGLIALYEFIIIIIAIPLFIIYLILTIVRKEPFIK